MGCLAGDVANGAAGTSPANVGSGSASQPMGVLTVINK